MTDDVWGPDRNGELAFGGLETLLKPPAASDTGASGQVLVIVKESGLATLLFYCLTAAGFRARLADGGVDGGRELGRGIPDVVLLDARLPDRRSTELWRQIRGLATERRRR